MSLQHTLWVVLYLILGYALALFLKKHIAKSAQDSEPWQREFLFKFMFGGIILTWPIFFIAMIWDVIDGDRKIRDRNNV